MKKIMKIALFEFMEKIKTRAFLIFMIVFPLIIIAISIVPSMLIDTSEDTTHPVGVLDFTGDYTQGLIRQLNEFKFPNGEPNYIVINLYSKDKSKDEMTKFADRLVMEGNIEGYIMVQPKGQDSLSVSYRNRSLGNFNDVPRFEKVFNNVYAAERLRRHGFDPSVINRLISNVQLNPVKIGQPGIQKEMSPEMIYFSSVIFLMLLFMMILFSGGLLIRSVVEEKSNRIMEILLSSCTPDELLTGKILGLGMLGLFQILVWAIIALALLGGHYIPMEIFHEIGLSMLYFVLGYLFYTAIFVGVGSVVTTEQEAQHFTGYLSIVLILPLVISLKVIQSPDILLVRILSFIPFTSPPIMLLRIKVMTPPVWEIILSTLILIFSIYLTIIITSKIFRIGILSYGKRPTMKELAVWLKEK
ncbi:MAG TPA: ABC transporter permease [Ignavibacteriales bacterium]|nr:ABC transporter permease [Ignavibacteriales bacterium]